MIRCVSDLRQIGGFLRILWFPPPMKLNDRHNIAEILLKVALNTIKQTNKQTSNRIGGVIVSVLASSVVDRGSTPDRIKPQI